MSIESAQLWLQSLLTLEFSTNPSIGSFAMTADMKEELLTDRHQDQLGCNSQAPARCSVAPSCERWPSGSSFISG